MKDARDKLLEKHQQLIQTDNVKVLSHVMREDGDWVQHTLMIENCETPFKFKRKQQYQNLKGARVNLSYYPTSEQVAGMDFEVMKVVRLRRS
ncbi:hypothetical protein [Neptunicella marina]|uniref:Uncharacterized protein n=1 Tax=Neptunicella marina TaxID=2125989 RepID=A0A8J6M0X8_9ALTE|nr:hypothetical protein [Neptunicella marina]